MEKAVATGGGGRLTLIADAYNLLNSNAVTSSVSGSWRENPRKGVQVRRACADT